MRDNLPEGDRKHTSHWGSSVERNTPVGTIQVLRLPQVCQVTGLGRSMIYQLEARKGFPNRIRIGQRAVGWIAEEVQAWLKDRVDRSRNVA
jgi:prophage regulatory protein